MPSAIRYTGSDNDPLLILAHGAGADSSSEFMTRMAMLISEHGICVGTFDFPYMVKRQEDGKKRPPDRAPKLVDAYIKVIEAAGRPCVIGGKSMGGRIASLVANEQEGDCSSSVVDAEAASVRDAYVKGCVCLGYPFHPPGKPDNLRTAHLLTLQTPTMIAQGTRDTMGTREEVQSYGLDERLGLIWLEDGNHDLKPRKTSGFTHDAHLEATAKSVADFVKRCL